MALKLCEWRRCGNFTAEFDLWALWQYCYNWIWICWSSRNSANIYLFKCNNRNARKRCELCSKLILKTPERREWCRSGVFIVMRCSEKELHRNISQNFQEDLSGGSLFLKLSELQRTTVTLLQWLQHRCFPWNFVKFFQIGYSIQLN